MAAKKSPNGKAPVRPGTHGLNGKGRPKPVNGKGPIMPSARPSRPAGRGRGTGSSAPIAGTEYKTTRSARPEAAAGSGNARRPSSRPTAAAGSGNGGKPKMTSPRSAVTATKSAKQYGLAGLSKAIEADLKKKGLKPGTIAWNYARKSANNNLTGIAMKRKAITGTKGPTAKVMNAATAPKKNALANIDRVITAALKKKGLTPGTAAWTKARKQADAKMIGVSAMKGKVSL